MSKRLGFAALSAGMALTLAACSAAAAGSPDPSRSDSAAAGIAGFAAGAILGGALAQQQYQAAPVYVVPNQSAVAYCSQRFRSYDPAAFETPTGREVNWKHTPVARLARLLEVALLDRLRVLLQANRPR